ncbi:MAG: HPP family protein [Pseudomonadota bacterium]
MMRFSAWLTPCMGWTDILISFLGGLIAIFSVYVISHAALGEGYAYWLVLSMGASTVLLFGAPHALFSQPWPLIAGHGLSAAVGVASAHWIPEPTLAAGCAVGGAIALMHVFRCIHPPGGATALSAVLGGPAITSLGFSFVLTPVLLNVLVLVMVALLFNYPFAWRRYPLRPQPQEETSSAKIKTADVEYALAHFDVVVDVSPDELKKLAEMALEHADAQAVPIPLRGRPVTWLEPPRD